MDDVEMKRLAVQIVCAELGKTKAKLTDACEHVRFDLAQAAVNMVACIDAMVDDYFEEPPPEQSNNEITTNE